MKKFSFIIVLFILVIGGFLAWWLNGTAAVNPLNKDQKSFSIKKGEGVRAVANNLKAQGLIKDPVIFYLVVRRLGIDSKIQAGDFFISPSLNATEVAKALQTGTYDVRIVIPEGKRAEEVADILRERVGSYNESWRAKLTLNEGYLFPDTYSFPKDVNIDQVISVMRDNFEAKYSQIEKDGGLNLSKKDVVILASMVEREAKHDQDRPIVASVLFNRLNADMPLYIDATIQYAIGTPKKWWPTLTDTGGNVAPNSPYNTYTHAGLPPTPISNPGIEVIKAVLNPAKTNYLYYITDKSGTNRYGRSLEEHNANIKKYGL
ncbi:MAG TPA: endolytic transglycosylase MltG [Candidatus Limnocylindrales bacterium]|nr:endolytic transglycosylase MltG [Candidatus Limnocylindrales bacterium]